VSPVDAKTGEEASGVCNLRPFGSVTSAGRAVEGEKQFGFLRRGGGDRQRYVEAAHLVSGADSGDEFWAGQIENIQVPVQRKLPDYS
jgi:hypothetical protein